MIWVLVGMILISPYEMNPYLKISSSFLGVFPDFTVIKALGLVGLTLAAVDAAAGGRIHLLRSSQARAFFFFLFLTVFATLMGGAAVRPLTRLLAIILLLPFVLAATRSPDNLRIAIKAVAASWILVFPYAIRQYFRYDQRLGVGLSEANYLGIALVLVLPLALVLGRYEQVAWKRWFWQGGAFLLFLSVVLTGSRGAFLGLAVVALLIVWRLLPNRTMGLMGMGAAFLFVLFVVPNPLLDRLLASTGLDPSAQDSIKVSDRTRETVLRGGLRMIRQHPIAGVGIGNFKSTLDSYPDIDTAKLAHNTYVEVGAELGLPALVAFLLVPLAAYRSLGRSARWAREAGDRFTRDVSMALQIGIVGYMTSALFLSAQFERHFWLVLFLTIGVERAARRARERRTAGREEPARLARVRPAPA